MGLCSSDDRLESKPKFVRIAGYKIKEGKKSDLEGAARAAFADQGAGFDQGASLTVVALADDKLVFVSVFEENAQLLKYAEDVKNKHLAHIEEFVDTNSIFEEHGTQFFRNFKPVKVGEFIRVSSYPGESDEKLREHANAYRKSLDKGIIPGQEGCAFAQNKDGHVFGYQVFDTKENCCKYSEGIQKRLADNGHSGEHHISLEGDVVFATVKASLFDALPLGSETRNAVGTTLDHVEGLFHHLPGGSYLVDGVTYTVNVAADGTETVIQTGKDGVETTYNVTTDGLKVVPGVDVVIDGAEKATNATTSAAGAAVSTTSGVLKTGVDAGKSAANATVDTAHDVASNTPGASHAMEAGKAAVDGAKDVGKATAGAAKSASDTVTPERSCWGS